MPSSYPPKGKQDGLSGSRGPSPYDDDFKPMTKLEGDRSYADRTPSPTPSELEALNTGALDWKSLTNWRFWIRKDWILYYIAFVIIIVVSVLLVIYHTQIVHWLTPVANWFHKFQFGWLVPIAILFVISFPPLFGHEIVAVLCGLVWGLWVGFAIVSAGTFLGEVGNFYAFKYCCRARGEKLERSKISYACLAKVIREGGFTIALVARLSAIPGHFTTAVFATCGMGIITFSIAAILSMPKQFITVYLGVILESSETGGRSKKSKLISDVVVALTLFVTFAAMWWIIRKMNQAKPAVIHDRRKARQAKLIRAQNSPYSNVNANDSSFSVVFNPGASEVELGLSPGPGYSPVHQRWDKSGHAVGYAGDPLLHAPQPKRAGDFRLAGQQLERDDLSPDPRFDRSPVRTPRSDPWVAEREGPLPSTSSIPLDTYPSAKSNPPAVQRGIDTQAHSYPLADLHHDPDPLPEPSYNRGTAPYATRFYTHSAEGTDGSYVTAIDSHPAPETDFVNRTPSPQSDLR